MSIIVVIPFLTDQTSIDNYRRIYPSKSVSFTNRYIHW